MRQGVRRGFDRLDAKRVVSTAFGWSVESAIGSDEISLKSAAPTARIATRVPSTMLAIVQNSGLWLWHWRSSLKECICSIRGMAREQDAL